MSLFLLVGEILLGFVFLTESNAELCGWYDANTVKP